MAIPPLEATKIWKKIMEFLEGVISLSSLIHKCRNHLHLLPHLFLVDFLLLPKRHPKAQEKKYGGFPRGPPKRKHVSSLHCFFFKRMMKNKHHVFCVQIGFEDVGLNLQFHLSFHFFCIGHGCDFIHFSNTQKSKNLRQTWEVWDKLVGATHVKIRGFGWKTASEWKPILARSVGKR